MNEVTHEDRPTTAGGRRGEEMTDYRLSRTTDIVGPSLAAIGALALMVWAGGTSYRTDLLVLTCAYALIALGMYVPFVMARSLSIAYGVYAAIGAYSVAMISEHTGFPLWLGWLIGAAISALLAIPLSVVTRRLSGFYLAAITLLFSQAFESWLASTDALGGSAGVGSLRSFSILGWTPGRSSWAGLAFVLVIVIATVLERLRRSPWGVTVRYMEDQPLPIDASGIRTKDLKTAALALGAAIASMGGALFTTSVGSVTPDTWTLEVVFLVIFIPLLGGRKTVWGSVLGAALVVQLTLNVSVAGISGQIFVALAVLIVLLVAPNGILGLANRVNMRIQGLRDTRRTRRRVSE